MGVLGYLNSTLRETKLALRMLGEDADTAVSPKCPNCCLDSSRFQPTGQSDKSERSFGCLTLVNIDMSQSRRGHRFLPSRSTAYPLQKHTSRTTFLTPLLGIPASRRPLFPCELMACVCMEVRFAWNGRARKI